jgi:hypothetical protein
MPYVGRSTDKISNVEVLDNITFDGSSSYTLQKNSVNFTPSSANTLLVSIDGVVQAGNFTVSGSTIDFGTAVAGTSTCDFILHYGIGLITTPSDGTVTTAKLGDASVTSAKLGSDVIQGITEADMWRLTADITADVNPIASNLERVDDASFAKIGTGMSVASGTWTFPRTGLYYVSVKSRILASLDNVAVQILGTINNSTYDLLVSTIASGASGTFLNDAIGFTYVNVTDTSNVKVRFQASSIDVGSSVGGSSSDNQTTFTFIRLGDSQ